MIGQPDRLSVDVDLLLHCVYITVVIVVLPLLFARPFPWCFAERKLRTVRSDEDVEQIGKGRRMV